MFVSLRLNLIPTLAKSNLYLRLTITQKHTVLFEGGVLRGLHADRYTCAALLVMVIYAGRLICFKHV